MHFNRLYFSCNINWRTPVCIGHIGTVTVPPILQMSQRGRCKGWSVGKIGGRRQSRASSSMVPLSLPSLRVNFQSLNQGVLALGSSMFSPFQPEIGTNATMSGLQPIFLTQVLASLMVSLQYLFWLQGGSVESILLTLMISCLTFKIQAKGHAHRSAHSWK